ncbi:MAG: hypothetical protein MI810_18705 [Flavobacteriales bacterium]|nr:hypothetical protein [Flavobacteriales bacterium]
MRDDFSNSTKETLAKRVGYKCSNPNCRKGTVGPRTEGNKTVNIGIAAHITAASEGGPRFNKDLSSAERKDISNGIWLCQNCAKLIDNDPSKYSVELIHKWKEISELSASLEIEAKSEDLKEKVEIKNSPNSIVQINESGDNIVNQKTVVNPKVELPAPIIKLLEIESLNEDNADELDGKYRSSIRFSFDASVQFSNLDVRVRSWMIQDVELNYLNGMYEHQSIIMPETKKVMGRRIHSPSPGEYRLVFRCNEYLEHVWKYIEFKVHDRIIQVTQ